MATLQAATTKGKEITKNMLILQAKLMPYSEVRKCTNTLTNQKMLPKKNTEKGSPGLQGGATTDLAIITFIHI